jgi:ribosome maturation factor RimP
MLDVDRLTDLIEPVLDAAGAELVDLQVVGSHGRPIVRAFVDTETGVTLDECARLSREIERAIEAAGVVPERYVLEVSSPGIDRPLTRRRHYERYAGREVEVRLYRKQGGRKKFVGTLERVVDLPDGSYAIEVRDAESGEAWTFSEEEISRSRLHVRW